jgi:hypothetical protein
VKASSLRATIDVVGYVAAQPCFTVLAPTAAVDTTSGVGLAKTGALAAGTSTGVNLGGASFLPGNAGIAPVHVRMSTGASPATVVITNDASPAVTVGTWRLAANSFWTGTYEFPPSVTDAYDITVTGSAVNLSLKPLGWFTDSNAHARSSDAVIDTALGLGARKAPLTSGRTITFATPSDLVQPAAVVLEVTGSPTKSDASGFIWPTGTPRPPIPTFNFPKGVSSLQQVVVSPATVGSTFSVRIGRGSTPLSVSVVGWVPFPAPVNEPVDGVTHVAASSDVTAPVVDPTTGSQILTYTGSEKLDIGDVVVQDSSPALPDGYLGVITDIAVPAVGTAPAALTSPDWRKSVRLSAASTADAKMASTDTVVTLRPGSLQDALPNADMDSALISVDSGDPPADTSDPLPSDTPPDPGAQPSTTAPATTVPATPLPWTPKGTTSTSTRTTASTVRTAASTTGGALPGSTNLSCSAGATVKVSTSIRLNAGLNLTGSWRLGQAPSAKFEADGGLTGGVAINASGGTTCNATASLAGPELPTIRFSIGPIPVLVRPVLTMDIKASGTVGAAFKASAGMDIGLATGVSYANNSFSPYFRPRAHFPVTVDARLGGALRVEVAPRLDLKVYGAAGPYFVLSAWAQGDVNLYANPWWTAQAGVAGDVGLKLDVWLIHANFSAGIRNLATWQAGSAPSPYPGPMIATSSLPSGSVSGRYSAQLSGSGGSPPLSWYRVSGSLPAGLSLSTSGAITGTPTTMQTSSFVVRAIDAAGYRSLSDKTLSMTVASGPSITTTTLPTGQVGAGYSSSVEATGGAAPYTWSVVGGALPPGLGLSSRGTISGTPTAAGQFSFTARVVDANGVPSPSDTTLPITIGSSPPPPLESSAVTVSWGARAAASICGGDTSCTYVTISWSGFSDGNHTITPYFDGQGNWCGSACANSLLRSGASGTLTGYWAAGYCRQAHGVSATVDGVGSNTISTTQHGC